MPPSAALLDKYHLEDATIQRVPATALSMEKDGIYCDAAEFSDEKENNAITHDDSKGNENKMVATKVESTDKNMRQLERELDIAVAEYETAATQEELKELELSSATDEESIDEILRQMKSNYTLVLLDVD